MDSGTLRPWDGGAVDDETINNGTLGLSGSGQWYKEVTRPWDNGTSDSGPWGNGQWDHENERTGKGTMHDGIMVLFLKLGKRDKGAVELWDIVQWDSGQANDGHLDIVTTDNGIVGQWDNGTVVPWDNRQGDNGPMSNETMDIGTMDTGTMRRGLDN
jgi:hypothetical protein